MKKSGGRKITDRGGKINERGDGGRNNIIFEFEL